MADRPAHETRTGDSRLELGRRLADEVLTPMKHTFVEKDEIIDLLGVCLVGRENLFILGPPGTAKSALVQELGRRLEGKTFDYLLTRFTEPNELFGPFDIGKLREGELVTNTEGMLPEASVVFLDELLNANSAILNSLLMVLNERLFRRGKETIELPLLMAVGASNHLPEDDALAALFDRFLLRVHCDNVPEEHLSEVLRAGWLLDSGQVERGTSLHMVDIARLQGLLVDVNLEPVRQSFMELILQLRNAGIAVSDRRAVKLQRLVAASALLCGRLEALPSDFWILEYIWDREEQEEVLRALVQEVLKREPTGGRRHPRSTVETAPDPEILARDLEAIRSSLDGTEEAARDTRLKDRLGVLAGRCQWIEDADQRAHLQLEVDQLWQRLGENS